MFSHQDIALLFYFPNLIRTNKGNAVPNAYPITAPIPPHVAAEGGPKRIQVPKAEATKLELNENVPIALLATK